VRFFRCFGLPWIMALIFFSTSLSAATYVETASDFQKHIQLHRTRVVVLGLALAKVHYPEISQEDLKIFLELHDTSKVDPKNSSQLFGFYGRPPANLEEKERLKSIVGSINEVDSQVGQKFFQENISLTPTQRSQFLTIEKVADLVDRSMDPVATEEFGRQMTRASQFLKDAEQARLSLWLEQRYHKLVPSLGMPSTGSCRRVF